MLILERLGRKGYIFFLFSIKCIKPVRRYLLKIFIFLYSIHDYTWLLRFYLLWKVQNHLQSAMTLLFKFIDNLRGQFYEFYTIYLYKWFDKQSLNFWMKTQTFRKIIIIITRLPFRFKVLCWMKISGSSSCLDVFCLAQCLEPPPGSKLILLSKLVKPTLDIFVPHNKSSL